MSNKYEALGSNLFGFEVFEEVFKVINERGMRDQEQMFKAGVASAEAAVRRLREEYYETLKFLADESVAQIFIGMKKCLISLLLTLVAVISYSQDVVTLTHKSYTTHYSKSKHYPVKVEWWVTRARLTCPVKAKRGDKFIADPKLPAETNLQADYTGQGFDRGHNFPAADAACDQVANDESFYFSNMTAQYPSLNRGDWKSLETLVRDYATKEDSLHVWCGSVGVAKKLGTTEVPTLCW